MKVLVVIPARGGSKGVPRKNVRPLAGAPLFVHSVLAAVELRQARPGDEVRIIVSSDDAAIVMRAADAGAEGMFRPAELATDTASTDAVLVHVLQELQANEGYRPDVVVLLQPTVPVRRPGLVAAAVERLEATGADSLLTANPLHFVWWRESPEYAYTEGSMGTGGASPASWRTQCLRRPPRQLLEERERMFHEDGSVFVTRTELLEAFGKRIGGHLEVLETERTVDIDSEEDFVLAEALMALRASAPKTEVA